MFQESFMDISKDFKTSSKEVSGGLQESFKEISWKIRGCVKSVLEEFRDILRAKTTRFVNKLGLSWGSTWLRQLALS